MEVHFAPELQAKIDQWVIETGYPVEKHLLTGNTFHPAAFQIVIFESEPAPFMVTRNR